MKLGPFNLQILQIKQRFSNQIQHGSSIKRTTFAIIFMRISFALILGVTFMACQNNNAQSNGKLTDSTKNKVDSKIETPTNSTDVKPFRWNKFVGLLSGDTLLTKSGLKNHSIWLNYARHTNKKWGVLSNRMSKPISEWVSSAKLDIKNEPKTLVYPFAGGDFYYSHLFFPKQDTIIMVGLEPAGYLFDVENSDSVKLSKYLTNLEQSLYFPHKLGFFRTLSMEVDFTKGYLNGTIHTCLYYMSKFGFDIQYIKAFDIDENGNPTKEVEVGTSAHKRQAIRIGFQDKNGTGAVKELIYISGDLSDKGLSSGGDSKKGNGLYKFLNNRKNIVSFFKAASYLMHNDYFSRIRGIMTRNSKRILQDDSGVPFAILKSSGFDVTVYGEYTRTIQLFRTRVQKDMKAEYAAKKPAKLPYNIGYNAEFKQCNMQSAVKR